MLIVGWVGACGLEPVASPRDCDVDGPIALLDVPDRKAHALWVGDRVLVRLEDQVSLTSLTTGACGGDVVTLGIASAQESGAPQFGVAGGELVACQPRNGAVDWVDSRGEQPSRRLFDRTLGCRLLRLGDGLAAPDPERQTVEFVAAPEDPQPNRTTLVDETIAYSETDPQVVVGGCWPHYDECAFSDGFPISEDQHIETLGDRLLVPRETGGLDEVFEDATTRRVTHHDIVEFLMLLPEREGALWMPRPDSDFVPMHLWDPEPGESTPVAGWPGWVTVAEPWLVQAKDTFHISKPVVAIEAINLEDGFEYRLEYEQPDFPEDHEPHVYTVPYQTVAALSDDALLVDFPIDHYDPEGGTIRTVLWPRTGQVEFVDFPARDLRRDVVRTDAGLYAYGAIEEPGPRRLRFLPAEGPPVQEVYDEEIGFFFATPKGQVVFTTYSPDDDTPRALLIAEPGQAPTVIDHDVRSLVVPTVPRPHIAGPKGRPAPDVTDVFYIADDELKRWPLP